MHATSSDDDSEIIFGILLAAGGGTRFRAAEHKLTALLRGRPVIEWSLSAALRARLRGLIVVTGAIELSLPEGVVVVHNPNWGAGQATSVQVGLQAARDQGADAVVVGLGDQPFVRTETWERVASTDSPIAVATYSGRRGNPVRLHRSVWPMLPTAGDEGARSLMTLRPDLVREVACSGSAADIDTMEDLHQWNSSTNSP